MKGTRWQREAMVSSMRSGVLVTSTKNACGGWLLQRPQEGVGRLALIAVERLGVRQDPHPRPASYGRQDTCSLISRIWSTR